MWTDAGDEQARQNGMAPIACHSCRRRKVKCDRKFPICQVCENTGQTCDYPPRANKPGPKIGSAQRRNKRRHRTCLSQTSQSDSPPVIPLSPDDNDAGRCLNSVGESVPRLHAQVEEAAHLPVRGGSDLGGEDQRRRDSQLNMHDLSFILHPSHEASSPDKERSTAPARDDLAQTNQLLIQQAFHSLGLSPTTMEQLVRIYFRNMVAVNLFHEPSFSEKLANMTAPSHICALLAALVAFASRFAPSEIDPATEREMDPTERARLSDPDHFLDVGLRFIDKALEGCGDEAPPICIVQALIVVTHCQLTRGVHGRAWRSLGMCVSLAYELDLHRVDALGSADYEQEDTARWRLAEEKRRAWWAVWEMDVFASTVRRTPTGIDWGQMETLLPADDTDWFHNRPVPSSVMEGDPVQRWKALQESGNQSHKAWFLVINSLMKEAQVISSPPGRPFQSGSGSRKAGMGRTPSSSSRSVGSSRQKLEILANAVQCFVMALPQHLAYRSQYLSFDDATTSGQAGNLRQLHSGIYNIFMMIQLARIMILRYDLFGLHPPSPRPGSEGRPASSDAPREGPSTLHNPDSPSVRQFFEAADNILAIVSHCSENHIQHINPFLPSIIWLASAVQLVRKYCGPKTTSPDLIQSRLDVLQMTYNRCARFWGTRTAMGQNLEMLEEQLEAHYRREKAEEPREVRETSARPSGNPTAGAPGAGHLGGSGQPPQHSPRGVTNQSQTWVGHEIEDPNAHIRYLPWSPPSSTVGEASGPKDATSQQPQAGASNCFAPHLPGLENMQIPPAERTEETAMRMHSMRPPSHAERNQMLMQEPLAGTVPSTTYPSFLDPAGSEAENMDGLQEGELEWRDMHIPADLQDILTGISVF